jgi:branched-chain amino acid transport system ATP-binding protein
LTAVVEVDQVSKRFGSLVVLDGVSFELRAGEALGIIGPNGAGKTTVLNLVAGDLHPNAGAVRFDGRDVTSLTANRRCRLGIGRTAQIPRPFTGLTAFENVLVGATFGAASRRQASPEATAVEALERAGMLAKANVPAVSLNLLDRKRLELARALATRPTVLLLDEIAGGLTEGEVHELVATVQAIHADGVSIIWIEHIVHALLSVVTRIVAMDEGRKLLEGPPRDVMASNEVREVYLGTDPEVAATVAEQEAS